MSLRGPPPADPCGGAWRSVRQSTFSPPVEIGFHHAQRIGVAGTFFVQVQQLAVGQPVERAARKATGEHRAADVTGAVVDPGLQVRRAHLGAPSGPWRTEAAGWPVAQRARDQPGDHQARQAEQLGQQARQEAQAEDQHAADGDGAQHDQHHAHPARQRGWIGAQEPGDAESDDGKDDQGQDDGRHGSRSRRRTLLAGERKDGAPGRSRRRLRLQLLSARSRWSGASARRFGYARRRLG
jgi:hypothetical protein